MTAKAILTAVGVLLVGWGAVTYFSDEDEITHLTGGYYTARSGGTGWALHFYANPDAPASKPLLAPVYGVETGGAYVVARAGIDVYFLFPVKATTIANAEQGQRGPFTRREVIRMLPVADTTLRQAGPF